MVMEAATVWKEDATSKGMIGNFEKTKFHTQKTTHSTPPRTKQEITAPDFHSYCSPEPNVKAKRIKTKPAVIKNAPNSWRVEGENKGDRGKATNGQVDVETPSPGDVRCESATNQGSQHRGDTKNNTNEGHGHGSLVDGEDLSDDDEDRGSNSTASHTGQDSSTDEDIHVVGESTHQGACFKEHDGGNHSRLSAKNNGDFAPNGNQGSHTDEESCGQPTDSVVGVELVSDGGEDGHDNKSVQGKQEETKKQ